MVASIVKIAAPVQGVTYYERGPRASGQIDMLDGADVSVSYTHLTLPTKA